VSPYYVAATLFFCVCAALQAIGVYLLFFWNREKRQKSEAQAVNDAWQDMTDGLLAEHASEALRDAVTEA
jgi:hypothetical protein